jgi:hypothetical protein
MRMPVYDIKYCPILNLFGRETHCELCFDCIAYAPKTCLPKELHQSSYRGPASWFPKHNSLRDQTIEGNQLIYTFDGDNWILYREEE